MSIFFVCRRYNSATTPAPCCTICMKSCVDIPYKISSSKPATRLKLQAFAAAWNDGPRNFVTNPVGITDILSAGKDCLYYRYRDLAKRNLTSKRKPITKASKTRFICDPMTFPDRRRLVSDRYLTTVGQIEKLASFIGTIDGLVADLSGGHNDQPYVYFSKQCGCSMVTNDKNPKVICN